MVKEVTAEEREILEALDRAVYSATALAEIQDVVRRVDNRLIAGTNNMAWEPIPLDRFGSALPPMIRSAWVFVLRAGINTGAERHPNSHQRMTSFAGTGNMDIRGSLHSEWTRNVLISDVDRPLERRWISIPPNVWHQPVIPPGENWVVVSFHTVPAPELIEERPSTDGDDTETKRMRYLS